MPTLYIWPTIQKGDFWLINSQHIVEASKKIQLMTEWDNPNHQKKKLNVWKALVIRFDDESKLSDISRYFNTWNKKKAYRASQMRKIMASREVQEFYGGPPKKGDNTKDKNSKWEMSMVWVDLPKLLSCFIVQVDRPKPLFCFIVWVH